jgi:flagellar biosynthesis/type III secretory pathway protein FliH
MSGFTPFGTFHRRAFKATSMGGDPLPEPEEPEVPEEVVEPPVDIEQLIAEAHAQGRAEAEAELRPKIAELEEVLANIGPALDQVAHLRKEALATAAGDVRDIVVAICRRVIDEAFMLEPQLVLDVVQRAVAELPDSEDLRIEVPPGQVQHIASHIDERYQLAVVATEAVRSGCVVRTRHVSIDSSLDAAMAGIEAALDEWQNNEPWTDEGWK